MLTQFCAHFLLVLRYLRNTWKIWGLNTIYMHLFHAADLVDQAEHCYNHINPKDLMDDGELFHSSWGTLRTCRGLLKKCATVPPCAYGLLLTRIEKANSDYISSHSFLSTTLFKTRFVFPATFPSLEVLLFFF